MIGEDSKWSVPKNLQAPWKSVGDNDDDGVLINVEAFKYPNTDRLTYSQSSPFLLFPPSLFFIPTKPTIILV